MRFDLADDRASSASVFDGAPEIKIKNQSNSAITISCVDTYALKDKLQVADPASYNVQTVCRDGAEPPVVGSGPSDGLLLLEVSTTRSRK